ncbi:hypothetical protein HQ45_08480 [Porphyromonas crevioricanis]|uniref:RNA polymerase sigma factor sigV n=2 Tax=Porphyromonas crevioricanis TaxID=393921 RepID=A0A0A2FK73_9PORP|nr:RNA polymerase sigma factor [Porphyromonas crevioricanis]KGN88724.1 hypothetical protein HQ45_08480 [Porphyromonas crevioricanis]KGN93906.1 hypothetical protein HQ38_07790 [Porphyromonas crevioricanis]SJZ89372.1 RNA polymerase sigma-70 factor, ECF subfamily [Porphyromonas crevioricanis]SQH73660.1 RNA polymerase sigma factor sigV [Porphyromonas crevioricanis]GAD05424.1 RNA polymerase sigma-70 factor, ECF subfamily [Porphyromonas crevioricanis JCM 15906]
MQKQEFIDKVVCLSSKLERIARSIAGDEDEAKDLVQEVLLRLWLSKERLAHYNNIEALASVMIKNKAIDSLRKQQRISICDDMSDLVSPTTTETALEQNELGQQLRQAIAMLPKLQRMTFFLKEVQGYEAEEIAQIIGSGVETVYNNLSRARRKLKENLLRAGVNN